MNDNKPTTSIRLPVDLKAKLQAEAEKQGRSLSNLIIFVLKQYVDQLDKETSWTPFLGLYRRFNVFVGKSLPNHLNRP